MSRSVSNIITYPVKTTLLGCPPYAQLKPKIGTIEKDLAKSVEDMKKAREKFLAIERGYIQLRSPNRPDDQR